MKKLNKMLLISCSTLVAAVPIVTTISCNSTNGHKIIKEQSKPLVDNVIPLDLITTIDTKPYSVDSLKNEANSINNHTIWKHGIPFEAATQAISTLRAFAESQGYKAEDYYKDNGFVIVDETNNVIQPTTQNSPIDAATQKDQDDFINVVKKLKEKSARTTSEMNESTLDIGTIHNDSTSLGIAGIDDGGVSSDDLEWGTKDEISKGQKSQIYFYEDAKKPGQRIAQFVNYNHKVVKFIRITNGNAIYPKVNDDFKVYVEATFQKFFSLFSTVSGMLGTAGYPVEQQDVVTFVQKNFCTYDKDGNTIFNITQQTFDNFWAKYNNGSHNIEALKVLLVGLDETFAANQDIIDMARNHTSDSLISPHPTSIGSTLDGAATMEVYVFLDWIYESRYTSSFGHTYYDPSKTLEDNIKDFTSGKTTLTGIN